MIVDASRVSPDTLELISLIDDASDETIADVLYFVLIPLDNISRGIKIERPDDPAPGSPVRYAREYLTDARELFFDPEYPVTNPEDPGLENGPNADLFRRVDDDEINGKKFSHALEQGLLALVDISGSDPNRAAVSAPAKVARRALQRIRATLLDD